MTMHLLPAYWTTTNHKKRKKKKKLTAPMEKSLREHEKFLKKMGVDPNYKRAPTPLKLGWKSEQLPSRNIKDYEWKVQTKKDAKQYNGNVVLGQAYNKGINICTLYTITYQSRILISSSLNYIF